MAYEFLKINRLRYRVRKITMEFIKEYEESGSFEKNILVIVSADLHDACGFVFSVSNIGDVDFKNVVICYEDFLLWAENFMCDTTHMPESWQRIPGEPIVIKSLSAGETVRIIRKGYGDQDKFDGRSVQYVKLKYELSCGILVEKNICVIVDLPNVRNRY